MTELELLVQTLDGQFLDHEECIRRHEAMQYGIRLQSSINVLMAIRDGWEVMVKLSKEGTVMDLTAYKGDQSFHLPYYILPYVKGACLCRSGDSDDRRVSVNLYSWAGSNSQEQLDTYIERLTRRRELDRMHEQVASAP